MTETATPVPPPPDLDLAEVDAIVARLGPHAEALIPALQAIQRHYKYLPEAALRRLAECTDMSPENIAGVSTFYSSFRHRPVGKHTVRVCVGTACHVKGADRVHDALRRHLKIEGDHDTDPEGLFTVEKVACLGCCTLAPVVQIGTTTYGHVEPAGVETMLRDFLGREEAAPAGSSGTAGPDREGAQGEVLVGLGSCCIAGGSAAVKEAVERALPGYGEGVKVKRVGCVGMCHQTPLLEIRKPGKDPVVYPKVQAEQVPAILDRHFHAQHPMARLRRGAQAALDHLLTGDRTFAQPRLPLDVRDPPVQAFLDRQVHLATEHGGRLDPLDLDEYRALGGFQALEDAWRTGNPETIIETIRDSGLRGRGGAGFPSGLKWDRVRRAPGHPKFLICNGDEGDPGAFMDRMILESYPFRVIEGMLLAAFAIGAHEGIFYIREEYPLALRRVREALARCEAAGLVGPTRPDGGPGVTLSIREGAGAFVCGEETAMIASLEGRRGMPRWRPPYPAERGFRDGPTLVSNCETFALVPWILRHGAEAFAALGTDHSKGTKVFALAGKIARGGLIEVPLGMTIREVVEQIGGGVANGRKLKAVQVGGPSGGCVPVSLIDTPIDFEALTQVGAMMGSGGFVVLDETDCMVDVARYFLSFTQRESCGRCVPCRLGTRRMLDILERLCRGEARPGDLDALEQLAHAVKRQSLCGLGKTASNPVLTTLAYFREEYEAHAQGCCPALRCAPLIRYEVTDECIGCTKCAQGCPVAAIEARPYAKHAIDDTLCIRCDTCRQVCPASAIRLVPRR